MGGGRVTVLKGVSIANNCVVGSGALLTGEYPEERAVIAGIPARVVRTGVDWLNQRI